MSRKAAAAGLLLIVTLLFYANCFSGVFVYDDFINIVNNPAVRTWDCAVSGTSRPLVNLTFWLHFKTGLLHAAHFHAVNLALHLANALLVYLIISHLLAGRVCMRGCSAESAALVTALIWAVHPVNTESVTYIVQRAEVLSAFFVLSGLYTGCLFLDGKSGRAAYVLVPLLFLLAYFSKPTSVFAPLLLVLTGRFTRTPAGPLVRRSAKILYLLSFLTLLVPVLYLSGTNESQTSAGFGMDYLPLWRYIWAQPGIILLYLWKMIWPWTLLLEYGLDCEVGLAEGGAALAAMLALAGSLWLIVKRSFAGRLGYLWFFTCMLPVLTVPIADLFAEHRLYMAGIGFTLLLVSLAAEGSSRLLPLRISGIASASLAVAAVILLGCRTWKRNADYSDPLILWTQVAQRAPSSLRGYLGAGAVYVERGDLQSGERMFRTGIEVYRTYEGEFMKKSFLTDYAYLCRNLGLVIAARGNTEEGAQLQKEASSLLKDFR